MQPQSTYMPLIVLVAVPLLLVVYVLLRVWLQSRARKVDRGFEVISNTGESSEQKSVETQ